MEQFGSKRGENYEILHRAANRRSAEQQAGRHGQEDAGALIRSVRNEDNILLGIRLGSGIPQNTMILNDVQKRCTKTMYKTMYKQTYKIDVLHDQQRRNTAWHTIS